MAYGLRPVGADRIGYVTSGPTKYPMADSYAGNVFFGDFVERLATGYVQRQETTTGLSPVAAHPTLGIAVGFEYTDTSGAVQQSNYYPASGGTNISVFVSDDVNQTYMIAAKSTGSTDITFADVGDNASALGYAHTAGSTSTGLSGIYLDTENIDQGARCFRILGIVEDGENENIDLSTSATLTKNVLVKIRKEVLQNELLDQIP
jgi:hypothetical protein